MAMTLSGTSGPASLTTPGYTYLPNGALMQWGRVSGNLGTNQTITFPTAFPNAMLSVVVSLEATPGQGFILRYYSPTTTNFQIAWDFYTTTGLGNNCVINYIATGY